MARIQFEWNGHMIEGGFSFLSKRGKTVVFRVVAVTSQQVFFLRENSDVRTRALVEVKRSEVGEWLEKNFRETCEAAQGRAAREEAHAEAIRFVNMVDEAVESGAIYALLASAQERADGIRWT